MIRKRRFALALSGGGYRTAAYHIGTMRALPRLCVLSCRALDACAAMMYSYIVKLSVDAAARFNLNSYGRNCN